MAEPAQASLTALSRHLWQATGLVPVLAATLGITAAALLPTTGSEASLAHWCAILGAGVSVGLVAVGFHWRAFWLSLSMLLVLLSEIADPQSGTPWARWASLAALPMLLGFVGLSLSTRYRWWPVAVVGGVLAGPVRMLLYDPFLDIDCTACLSTPSLLEPHLAAASALAFVGGALIIVGLAAGLPASRHRLLLGLVVGAAFLSIMSFAGVQGVLAPAVLFAGWIAVLGGALALVHVAQARSRLSRLSAALHSGDGPETALKELLADPGLSVNFSADEAAGPWVAAQGGPVDLTPEIRWALEHARLSALLQAQVRELDASRARVVAHSFEQRRLLERNLHDGAQQHLLALGFDLRRALAAAAETDADHDTLQRCLDHTSLALEELRVLARGLSPTLLTSSGLGPSLQALARALGVAIDIEQLPSQRCPAVVEQTAYLLVSELAHVGDLAVSGKLVGGCLCLVVTGGDLSPDSIARERVDALGGTLIHMPDRIEVRLPCG